MAGAARMRVFILAVIILLAAGVNGPRPAGAQDLRNLLNRVERVEREIQDLQSQFYRGGQKPAGTAAAGGAVASAGDAARTEIRLQQLETQIRNLTGQFERLAHDQRQLLNQVDRLVGDIDFRLRELGGGPAPAGPGPAGQAPARQTQPAAPPGAKPSKPGVLGTLTRQDLDRIERGGAQVPAPAAGTGRKILPDGSTREKYRFAFNLLTKRELARAEAAFAEFLADHGRDALAGNASYWLGETHYVRGNYADAAVVFAEGYQNYPGSSKIADNLLKLAMSLARLRREEDACFALARLAEQFPNASTSIKRQAEREKKRLECKS